MIRALAMVMVAALPVTLPHEWGRLKVLSVETQGRGHYFELEYLDDSPTGMEQVYIECTLFDTRGDVIITQREAVEMPPREPVRVKLLVKDALGLSSRAECELAMGKPKRPAK